LLAKRTISTIIKGNGSKSEYMRNFRFLSKEKIRIKISATKKEITRPNDEITKTQGHTDFTDSEESNAITEKGATNVTEMVAAI